METTSEVFTTWKNGHEVHRHWQNELADRYGLKLEHLPS